MKGRLIEEVNNLIGTSNIKGFWIFDETGATTAIAGRQPANTGGSVLGATLGGNASTLTPSIAGMCPNLTMSNNTTASWSVADNADFSFDGDGASDAPFSVVALVNLTDATSNVLVAKATTVAQAEWDFAILDTDKLATYCGHPNWAAYIGRSYNTAITSDEGSWHCYISTYDGGGLAAGLKIYRDGTRVDDTNASNGAYTAMTGGTSPVASYDDAKYLKGKNGVTLVISKELTAEEVRRLDWILRSYAGVDI
jgi:hypothetical protein